MKILLLSRENSFNEILPSLKLFGEVDTSFSNISNIDIKKYDIGISYSYAPILKKDILENISFDIINLHPTYLPYGRGIYGILWAAHLGYPQGATIHKIDYGIDTGPIYLRKKICLDRCLNLEQAREILVGAARQMLFENIFNIVNRKLKPKKQTQINNKVFYKSRPESVKFFKSLKYGWNTKLDEIPKAY